MRCKTSNDTLYKKEKVMTENKKTAAVDFKEQIPEMLIGEEKQDALYEKAFLSRDDKSETEYALNTTTWD